VLEEYPVPAHGAAARSGWCGAVPRLHMAQLTLAAPGALPQFYFLETGSPSSPAPHAWAGRVATEATVPHKDKVQCYYCLSDATVSLVRVIGFRIR
jgi:hypothetical protein